VPRGQIAVGYSAHNLLAKGDVPLPSNAGVAIAGLYHRLGVHDPDGEVQYVARELEHGLGRYVAGPGHP
jgi:hypothetical protein